METTTWQQELAVGACTYVTVVGNYSIRAVLANVGVFVPCY